MDEGRGIYMKLGVKIGIGQSVILVLIMVLGVSFYFAAQQSTMSVSAIEEANAKALLASKAENIYTGAVLEIRRYIADGHDSNRQGFIDRMETVLELEHKLLDKAGPAEKAAVEKLISDTNAYYTGVKGRLIPAITEMQAAKKNGDAVRLAQTAELSSAITKELTPFAQELQKALAAIVDGNSKIINDQVGQSKANAATDRVLSMALGIIVLIAGIALSAFLTKMVTSPIKATTSALEGMAAGDYSKAIDQALISRNDEFGNMGQSLDKLRGNMRDLIGQMARQAEHLAASSEELTASAEQSALAANQVAVSINEVAAGVDEQLAAASETSNVVEQMSVGVQQMAASANQVADQSAQAAGKAKDGGKTVETAVGQMAQIEDTVNTSAQVVAKLGERSKEIGQIVDTISGIAGQTNLLALNAAIEAARAGEQGRGFAVVAEEVRKLAEQSQDAAKKIAGLIGEIQGETDKAVIAMNDGTREVKTGAEAVNAAGAVFQEIAELVTQVSGQVKDISAAIQQTAAGSQQIVGVVKKIDELSKKSADEAQSVSAATEEQLASMEEIASSSQALSKLAQELQAEMAKFHI